MNTWSEYIKIFKQKKNDFLSFKVQHNTELTVYALWTEGFIAWRLYYTALVYPGVTSKLESKALWIKTYTLFHNNSNIAYFTPQMRKIVLV